MIAIAIAGYLDTNAENVTFNQNESGGNCFIAHMEDSPDLALKLTPSGGYPAPGSPRGYDVPTIQVITRGAADDPIGPYALAREVYYHLEGLHGETVDGFFIVDCHAVQSDPASLGTDEKNRYLYSQNYIIDVRAATAHRD